MPVLMAMSISGTQRAGTTLLCRMLSVHPNIYIRNEIPGIKKIVSGENDRNKMMTGFDEAMVSSFGYGMKGYLEKFNKKRWGVKDPELTQVLEPLRNAFPDAKLIFIIRDGRAVANSYIKNMWGLGVNTYHGALRWKREVGTQLTFAEKYKGDCHVVRFEDLILDHEKELRRICKFIIEPYSENLTEYYKFDTEITKRRQSKNVFKKPDIRLTEKWKNDLSNKQIKVLDYF